LRAQGKDASRLCSETQDLYESLIHYFLAAAIAGRFTARGFIRGVTQILDPKLFRLPGLQLRLDKNTIELPGAFSVFGIELRINGELECSGISDAPGEVVSKAHGSKLMCDEIAENDPQPPPPPPLRGKELDDALDRWALALCGGNLTKLPADCTLDRYGVDRTKDLCGADLTKL
jgi:hypothetical protein